jgi:hypothetical protein
MVTAPPYRKWIIIVLDLIFSGWLIKLMFFSEPTDFLGVFLFIYIASVIAYNLYGFYIIEHFSTNSRRLIFLEILFFCLLLAPILAVWYLLWRFFVKDLLMGGLKHTLVDGAVTWGKSVLSHGKGPVQIR